MDRFTHSRQRSRSTPYASPSPSPSAMDLPSMGPEFPSFGMDPGFPNLGMDAEFSSFLFLLFNGKKLPYLAIPMSSPSQYSFAPAVCLIDSTSSYSSIIPAIPVDLLDDKIFQVRSVFLGHLDFWFYFPSYARWGDWIYVISGFQPGSSGSSFSMTSQIARFYLEQIKEFVCRGVDYELMSPMHSAKGEIFLVLEHKNFIYVLSRMFKFKPLHTFEVYDCLHDKWEVLESSPFHNSGAYHTDYGLFSYIVIDDRICVSSIRGAFYYDISAKRWEPCYLFEDFSYPPLPKLNFSLFDVALSFARHECSLHDCELYEGGNVSKVAGSPFKFLGQGLLYENDILICKSRNGKFVLAYRIESCRVVEMQYLIFFALGLQWEYWLPPGGLDMDMDMSVNQSDPMVYLGCGCFSLTCRRMINGATKFLVLTFRISRLAMADASKDKFLACDIISLTAIKDVEKNDQLTPFVL